MAKSTLIRMSEPWLPSGASLDDFVSRVQQQIARYTETEGLPQARVEVELRDGARHLLDTISAEPGYGFVTLRPHATDGEERREIILPLDSVARITISPAEREPQFGFTGPQDDPR
jgi:hypothetical protein